MNTGKSLKEDFLGEELFLDFETVITRIHANESYGKNRKGNKGMVRKLKGTIKGRATA